MTDSVDPRRPTYDPSSKAAQTTYAWGVFGAVAAILSIAACVLAAAGKLAGGKATMPVLAAAWAIGAPVWFWYEYFFLYRKHANEGSWELFKHGQQLGIAIWAAMSASLAAFVLSPWSEPGDKLPQVECSVRAIDPEKSANSETQQPAPKAAAFQIQRAK